MEAAAAKIKEDYEAAMTKAAEDHHMAAVSDCHGMVDSTVRRDEGCAKLIWIFTPKTMLSAT